jgi:hypothetical protein
MKNQKFALTLALEENEELMAEIDALIRERAKAIVREEAEKMLGGAIQEEAKRVAEAKIAAMPSYDFNRDVRNAIHSVIQWDDDMLKIVKETVENWCKNNSYTINCHIKDFIYHKLSGIVQVDVIKAVTDALTKR